MPLSLNNRELMELLEYFYVLTGIRIALFDESYNEIASYPADGTSFCSYMRQRRCFDAKCRESDSFSFKKCNKTKSLSIYKCHAGLIEATAPLTENGTIIGYIMFGQITDSRDKSALTARVMRLYRDDGIEEKIKKIKYKSNRQILAAAKILDACTSYIQLKEMVKPSRVQLISRIDRYIDENLDKALSVETLCREFSISRTRLYSAVKAYAPDGIAALIKQKRLAKARTLVKSTDMPTADIAYAVGFNDYNYFLRVFRREFGISPKKLRQAEKS